MPGVLRELGTESVSQSLARQDGRAYDRPNLADGTTVQLDVTGQLQALDRAIQAKPAPRKRKWRPFGR